MNTLNEKNNDNQIKRLANTLTSAFLLDSDNTSFKKIGNDIECSNHEAVESWIQQVLLNPDKKLAECLLPLLVPRLQDSLTNGGDYE